jgi:hypothetical protein
LDLLDHTLDFLYDTKTWRECLGRRVSWTDVQWIEVNIIFFLPTSSFGIRACLMTDTVTIMLSAGELLANGRKAFSISTQAVNNKILELETANFQAQ